jgi:dTDP-4-amino-4,6-dideoxygalactose transaminase
MSKDPFIPFNRPEIDDAEIAEVVSTLRSGWLTTGVRTAQFEKEFRDYVGAKHAQAVSSCTAALHLALAALNIGPGDEVITTPLTFCATVSVIVHVGATPVLADILPDGNIDPASIAERITPRTKAIIPVHLAGAPCDMDAIWKIGEEAPALCDRRRGPRGGHRVSRPQDWLIGTSERRGVFQFLRDQESDYG